MDNEVKSLWEFKLRRLGLTERDREHFYLHAACTNHTTEREVVQQIKKRFTPEWWDGFLILSVEQIGELHMIDGVPLYEGD